MCNYTTHSQKSLTYHIIRRHKDDSNFHVTCTFPSCFYSSKSWSGFKTHFSRQHRQKIDVGAVCTPHEIDGMEDGTTCDTQEALVCECANFALKLQSKLKMPASAVDDIIESTINLVSKAQEIRDNPLLNVTDALSRFSYSKAPNILFNQKQCLCGTRRSHFRALIFSERRKRSAS